MSYRQREKVGEDRGKGKGTLKNSKSALIRAGKVEENRQVTKTAIQLVGYFARFPQKRERREAMNTKERTDMALRAAFNYLRRSRKTPLQKIAEACGRTRRHIQGISSETERKPMSGELAHKIAAVYDLTYEQFLNLGVCLLNGADGEAALTGLRTLASRKNPELRHLTSPSMRVGWKNAAPMSGNTVSNGTRNVNGVNNGTVQAYGGPPCPESVTAYSDEKRRNFDQTLTGWFAGVCDWWATEHGTDSRSPVAFFREFDRRFPEYVAWSKAEKE